MNMLRHTRRPWPLLALLAAAFLARSYRLSLPGPYGDEISFVLPAFQMRWGQPLPDDVETLRVLGHVLPIAFNPFTGPLPIYAQYFFSYVVSGHWFDFRILDILYAVGAIGFAYAFARDFLGKRAALFTALFLAFMPSFVFYSRLGEPWHVMRVLLATVLLFTLYRWWRTDRRWYFYAACLSVGLGLSDRLELVWWALTIPIAATAVRPAAAPAALRRLLTRTGESATGIGLALFGAAPFLLYNRHPWRWGTIVYLRKNIVTTRNGYNNAAFAHNLDIRIRHLTSVLSGSDGSAFGVPGVLHANPLWPVVFLVSALGLVWVAARRRRVRQPDRHVEFLLVATSLMFALSTVTPTVLAPYQLLILFPLPVLLVARALSAKTESGRITSVRARAAGAAAWVMVAALVGGDLVADAQYYQALVRTGGVGEYSSGIFTLVDWLRQRHITDIVACDWRLLQLVEYATHGVIGGEEIIEHGNKAGEFPPSFVPKMRASLQQPSRVYIFYAPQYEEFKRRAAFLSLLGARPYELTVLSDHNGPIYYVYRTLPPASRPIPPAARGRLRRADVPGGTVGRAAARFDFQPPEPVHMRSVVPAAPPEPAQRAAGRDR
jgi:hypothetical protein